jgi:hypothetical protein
VSHSARARCPGPSRVRVIGPDDALDEIGVVITWATPRCIINIQYIYILMTYINMRSRHPLTKRIDDFVLPEILNIRRLFHS